MENIKSHLENKIKEYGMTKKLCAEKMGIDPANLNKMIISPSYPTLEKMAKTLGVTLAELLADDTQTTPVSSPTLICPHCGKPIEIVVKGKQ